MSDSNASVNASAKMGLAGWLTLVFVILKLNPGGYLDSAVEGWSWWLVFAPVLIGVGFLLVILLGIGIAVLVAVTHDWWIKRRQKKDAKATANMNFAERREYYANKRKK